MKWRTALLAPVAIAAFAGNSLIARTALGWQLIEPGAFSVVRLATGALVLLPALGRRPSLSDLRGGLALLIYMVGFSLANRGLSTATGALILFGGVQATVIAGGVAQGHRVGFRA